MLDVIQIVDDGVVRCRNTCGSHHVLGHALVQGQGTYQGVRKHVRNLVRVEQRRHLCLASDAVHAFADIEHEVPGIALDEACSELLDVADAIDVVALARQHRLDAVDRIGAVKLGGFDLAVASGQVSVAQVVGQANPNFGSVSLFVSGTLHRRCPESG